jgi:hypothetical protein
MYSLEDVKRHKRDVAQRDTRIPLRDLAIKCWYYVCINHRSSTNYFDLANRLNKFYPGIDYDYLKERMPAVIRYLRKYGFEVEDYLLNGLKRIKPEVSWGYNIAKDHGDPDAFWIWCRQQVEL